MRNIMIFVSKIFRPRLSCPEKLCVLQCYEQRYLIRVVADPHTEVYGITGHMQKRAVTKGSYAMSSRHNLDIYGMNACCEFDKISCSFRLALRTFVIYVNLDLDISLVCQMKAEVKKGEKWKTCFCFQLLKVVQILPSSEILSLIHI